MLKALLRWLWPLDADERRQGRRTEYITPEYLEQRLKKFEDAQEYEFNEWYEKFNTLHARLTKRLKRDTVTASGETPATPGTDGPAHSELPSVLHFRRPGSV